jgi:hypothetical protein
MPRLTISTFSLDIAREYPSRVLLSMEAVAQRARGTATATPADRASATAEVPRDGTGADQPRFVVPVF